MDADTLLPVLAERLDSADIADEAKLLVYAAYEGDESLRSMLAGAVSGDLPDLPAPEPVEAPRTYLAGITAAGFRGVGPEQTLRLQPGPGLTLVVGRNGSGKSSFAQAAEVALTGSNARWAGRGSVWKEGWRNLHADTAPASVTVDLAVDGQAGATRVRREWASDDVDDCTGWTQRTGQPRAGLDTLDWSDALTTYRPFLSYSELGSMLQGPPSALYDALASILGLEPLTAAEKRLKAALKTLDDDAKRVGAEKNRLVAELEGVDDERARRTAAALRARQPDLDAVAELLWADSPAAAQDLGRLRAWAGLVLPDPAGALAAAETLVTAQRRAEAVAGTESGQAQRLAELLEAALDHAAHSATTDCPVCGTSDRLDAAWRTATEEQVRRLRRDAEEADQARRDLAPLTEGAVAVWQGLRQESNVDLGPVRLEGAATRRLTRSWCSRTMTGCPRPSGGSSCPPRSGRSPGGSAAWSS
jgi:DNA repair exonuclease SbcCD ATPase subunit